MPTITICLLDRSKMNSECEKMNYFSDSILLYSVGYRFCMTKWSRFSSVSCWFTLVKEPFHLITKRAFVDERRRTKLLKASSEEKSSKTGFNLKQFHRSKSDIPTGDKPQRAPLLHQSSGNVLFHFLIQTFIDHKIHQRSYIW